MRWRLSSLAKPASNSEPLSDSTTLGLAGSSDRMAASAASVWQAALLGRATARPKALAGSMQVRMVRRRPSRTRSTVSTAKHCSGTVRTPRGLRGLG